MGRGVIRRVDFRAADGTSIADNGYQASWSRSQVSLLLDACKEHNVKIVAYHTDSAWTNRCR